VFTVGWDGLGWWALAPGVLTLGLGIAVEATLLLRWLGSVFESTDPAAAEIPV
jgi:hypothetical protein